MDQILDIILDDLTSRERRDLVYLGNDALQYCTTWKPTIATGSFFEGMANFGDFDLMFIAEDFIIVDCIDDITDDIDEDIGILFIDSEECNPGFARLIVYKEPLIKMQYYRLHEYYTFHNDKLYLNGQKIIAKTISGLQDNMKHHKTQYESHGPAVLTYRGRDCVICFPCMENLQSIKSFQKQHPREISNKNDSFYFISKSHKNSEFPDIEFRWSFSVVENNIIRDLTDKEFQLYFLCKELYGTYLKSNDANRCISSYTMKTIILHFRERNKEEIKSKSILNLVKSILCNLRLSLQEKFLPNYFIRKYNMFDVIKNKEVQFAIEGIETIEKDLVLAALNCNFFKKFGSLITLSSIYQITTKIDDLDMKVNIIKNILKEKSFKSFHSFNNMLLPHISTNRSYLNKKTYMAVMETFQSQISNSYHFDVLCFYFHCSSLFKGKYTDNVIEKFMFLFSRSLAVFLMNKAPKNNKRSLIHLLIEILLHRSIHLPNPIPSMIFHDRIALAFYYYLCEENKKAFIELTKLNGQKMCNIYFVVFGCYNTSIVSNDTIFKEYFGSYGTPLKGLTLTPQFLANYMILRLLPTEDAFRCFIKFEEETIWGQDESDILRLLKRYFQQQRYERMDSAQTHCLDTNSDINNYSVIFNTPQVDTKLCELSFWP